MMDTSAGHTSGPLGGGQRSPFERAYDYSGSGKPVWTGGRSGNPTQYQIDLKNWKRAQGLLAAPQAPQQAPGLKWSPMSYGPINLTAGSGYGLQPYGMTTSPFRYFGLK